MAEHFIVNNSNCNTVVYACICVGEGISVERQVVDMKPQADLQIQNYLLLTKHTGSFTCLLL